jgi:Sulfatase
MSHAGNFYHDRWRSHLGRMTARHGLRIGAIVGLHLAALILMARTEHDLFGQTLFLLSWAVTNCVLIALFARPGIAAAISLVLFGVIVMLSQFKSTMLWMTITFFDILVVDSDTIAFLLSIIPDLRTNVVVAALIGIPLLVLTWRLDPFRIPRWSAGATGSTCFLFIAGLSLYVPEHPSEPFQGVNHVSNFARSGVTSVYELSTRGWFDADGASPDPLLLPASEPCQPASKPPHIIMVLDEASFDITAVPDVKVPPDYARHFESFDGKKRLLVVEGSGGPTWYTEYNVLTGLSARSYGRLSFYVTRIAAGRVERGLPQALRRCGYKTITLYPAYGAFLSARRFQESAGVERLIDSSEMKAGDLEPDRFFYDQAIRMIESERGGQPLFLFVYTVFNHFPWSLRPRPDLTPDWRDLGNHPEVDEYIRRQTLSARDYAEFKQRLQRDYPGESFLIFRFGDHQPGLSAKIVDPLASNAEIARRIMSYDFRYFTTYYAIDAINFQPKDVSAALERLEAPYLPVVVQEAAGLQLDPTFAEQKKILARCQGLFFSCAGGAEARRFNRLLIDAGLIKGMVSR